MKSLFHIAAHAMVFLSLKWHKLHNWESYNICTDINKNSTSTMWGCFCMSFIKQNITLEQFGWFVELGCFFAHLIPENHTADKCYLLFMFISLWDVMAHITWLTMPEMNNFTVMVLQTNNLMITVKDSNYAVHNQYSQNRTSEV